MKLVELTGYQGRKPMYVDPTEVVLVNLDLDESCTVVHLRHRLKWIKVNELPEEVAKRIAEATKENKNG